MTIIRIPLERITENPWQTRRGADPEYIKELAEDIKANGLLQVPKGRFVDKDKKPLEGLAGTEALSNLDGDWLAQLAFGHCRLAAFKILAEGDEYFKEMPVEMRDLTDVEMADIAWSENEKRRDNTPLDRALAIQKRIEDFEWTHEQVAEHLQISRSAVSNALRLLKLPEDILARLGEGLPERTALALLSLFDLPEEFRKVAERQSDYSWDYHSGESKPSKIVADALAGESSEKIRQRIEVLIKKFGENLSAAPWKYSSDFYLLLMGIELPENLSLTALLSPACADCQFRQDNHICLDKNCYYTKLKMWEIYTLHQAGQESGLPYLIDDEANRFPRSSLSGYPASQYAAGIIATKCENLCLIYNGVKAERTAPDVLENHPYVRIICQKRTGSCSCLQGLQAKARSAATAPAPQSAAASPVPAVTQSTIDEESMPEGKTLADVFDQEDLEAAAREARRNRKASFDLIPRIKDQAAEILAGELAGYNQKIWLDIVGQIHWKTGRETVEGELDFDKLTELLGRALVEHNTPTEDNFRGIENPVGYVSRVLNRYLEDKKCPELNEPIEVEIDMDHLK